MKTLAKAALSSALLTSSAWAAADLPRLAPPVPQRAPVRQEAIPTVAAQPELTTAEKLERITAVIPLNKTELASILQVARPTIYAWFDGEQSPKDESNRRLQFFTDLVTRLQERGYDQINARALKKSGFVDFASNCHDMAASIELENLLISAQDELKKNSLMNLLAQRGISPLSREEQEHNLQLNTRLQGS